MTVAEICTDCMSTGGAHSRLCPTQPYMQERSALRELLRAIASTGTVYDADIGKPEWTPNTRGYVVLTVAQAELLKGLI